MEIQLVGLRAGFFPGRVHRHRDHRARRVVEQEGLAGQASITERVGISGRFRPAVVFIDAATGGPGVGREDRHGLRLGVGLDRIGVGHVGSEAGQGTAGRIAVGFVEVLLQRRLVLIFEAQTTVVEGPPLRRQLGGYLKLGVQADGWLLDRILH